MPPSLLRAKSAVCHRLDILRSNAILAFRRTPATGILALLIVATFLAQQVLDANNPKSHPLLSFGALECHAVVHGQWWRAVSYLFIHLGWIHFLGNLAALVILGPKVERLLGSAAFVGICLFCALTAAGLTIGSQLAHCPLVSQQPVVGASGFLVGMAVVVGIFHGKDLAFDLGIINLPFRWVIFAYMGWTVFSLLTRFHAGGEMAHLGSGLAGGLLGLLILFFSTLRTRRNQEQEHLDLCQEPEMCEHLVPPKTCL